MTVPASGPKNAKLAVVGMAPADEEVRLGIPFMGPSGNILNTSLRRLGVDRNDVFVTNVSNEPLPANSPSLFALPINERLAQTARLRAELEEVRPNCLFVLGDEPMQIVCGQVGVMKWRGSILPSTLVPGLKCVVSLHPAAIIRGAMWKWEAVFRHVDLGRALAETTTPDIKLPHRNSIIRPTFGMVMSYIDACKRQDWLSFDYETLGDMRMACIGIGYREDEAMCIPFLGDNGQNYWSESEEITIMRAVADLLESDVPKIGQNLSFEWIISMAHRIYPRRIGIDTMLLHHCLYPDFGGTEDFIGNKRNVGDPGHSLRFINSQYTRTPFYKDDRKIWTSGTGNIDSFWRYNTLDVMVTYEAAMKMLDEARARNLWEFYQRFYNRPFPHTVRMEWQGVLVDKQKRDQAHREATDELNRMTEELERLVGHPLNIWSTVQMKNLLYKELGYAPRRNKKSGHITADRATLEYLAIKNNDPRLELIVEMRKLADMRSDVLESKLGADGRMHTHYKLGGTDGARWSSTKSILGSGINFQNVPRGGIARRLYLPGSENTDGQT